MEAALLLCIELDTAGEFTENLTILTKDQWIKPHYNFEEEEVSGNNKKKIGTNKNRRQYEIKVN